MHRRSVSIVSIAAALVSAATVAAQSRQERISTAATGLYDSLVEQRRDFHRHPELSNREERTSRVIAERLRALGLDEVRTGIGKYGVVGILKGSRPGPVVALRADMDALPIEETLDVPYKSQNPGVKHACGHDVHMTVELGAATVLSKMRQELPGTVMFIFQPAEEGAPEGEEGGAKRMLKEGLFSSPKPAAIFGLHVTGGQPVGTVGYVSGGAMASTDRFRIRIIGKGTHAAYPHNGVDPIVTASEAVLALQTIRSRDIDPVKPLVITVGLMRAGTRFNIIPDEAVLEGTVRTLDQDVRDRIPTLMRRVLDGVTKAHGASYALDWFSEYPVTYNNPQLTEESAVVLRRVLGEKNVIHTSPVMGAEDFSFYAEEVPGFFYWLGVANEAKGITANIHTAAFDADEHALLVGVNAMCNLVFDYLEHHQ